jgi:hypothetical protein
MKTGLPLPPRKRKLINWVLGFLFVYAIVGFFILPPIIRAVAVKQLSAQLDRKVTIQKIRLNPFAFSTSVRGLLIQDKDGQPFVSWDEVYVRFQLSSIFLKEWTFKEIRVTKPYARVEMNKDYTFNFSDIIEKFSTNAPTPTKPSPPLLVRVKQLSVTNATVAITDFTERTPFRRTVGPLDFNLKDFHTAPGIDSPYSVAGTTDAGENFAWHGSVCLTPLRSEGRLTVNDITLSNFAPIYQDLVQFEIRGGQIGAHAEYRFEWSATNKVAAVTNAAFALRKFRLAQPGATNDLIDVFHLAVTGASLDLEGHDAEIGRIFVTGAQANLLRDTNKNINVVEISKPSENAASNAGSIELLLRSVTNVVTMLINSTNQWNAAIHAVDMTNCSIHLVDLANSRPAKLNLDGISVVAKNISNKPNTNLTATVALCWNTNGTIKVDARACISPLAADVHLDLNDLGLNTLDPYLEPFANVLILDARYGLNGDVHVRTPQGGLPEIKFQGDTWLDHLHVADGLRGQDLVKWDSVRVSGIEANLNPLAVSIKQISVNNVVANAVIETNGAINMLEAASPAGAPAVTQTNARVIAAKSKMPPGTNILSIQGLPQVTIDAVVVTNTRLNYTDRSLEPNVTIVIEQGGGTIRGLSSEQLDHADVDLHALVDGVGPVQVTGHINPFSGTWTNAVNVSLKSLDLLPTSPYAGKFAGYRIARGNLNLDLDYHLVGRKLDSQNHIMVDQFTFGDKVDSPDATKLPVRLAVAILKDRQGQIVLDVPIQGSLDDPKFRIGKVVVYALENILTKVATSPFSLLGAAFGGGGEELSYQDFDPGSTDLTESSKKKLDVITKALYDRPGLQLQISGSIDPVNDRDGLQRAAFEKKLRNTKWMSLSKSEQAATQPDDIVLAPDERSHLIKQLYDQALKDGTITPALFTANTNLAIIAAHIKAPLPQNIKLAILLVQKSQSDSSPNTPSAPAPAPSNGGLAPPADPMEALLTAIIPVSDSDLETLALERAKAVRGYILQSGKVEAGRLFLAQNQGGGLRRDGNKVYLELN